MKPGVNDRVAAIQLAWSTAAGTVVPDRPDLASFLEARLTTLHSANTLDEASLLEVVDEAAGLVDEGQPATAKLLRMRLQRNVYEFLLALDATSPTEGDAPPATTPTHRGAERVESAPEDPEPSAVTAPTGDADRPSWTSPEFWGESAQASAAGPPHGLPDLPFIAPRSGFHLTDPSQVQRAGPAAPARQGGNFTETQSVPPGSSGYGARQQRGRSAQQPTPPAARPEAPSPAPANQRDLPEQEPSWPRPPQPHHPASGGEAEQRQDYGAPPAPVPSQYQSGPGAPPPGSGEYPQGPSAWQSEPRQQPSSAGQVTPPQEPDGYGSAIELSPEDFEDAPAAARPADLSRERRQIDELLRHKRSDQVAGMLQQLAQEIGGREVAELALDAGDRSRALGKKMASTNCYLAATRADPLYDVPLQRLADLCIDDRDIDTAVSYLERIAWICRRRGDGRGALRVYRRIVTVAPYREDILEKLMRAQQTGRLD